MDLEKAEYEIQHFGFSVDQMKYERRHFIKATLKSRLEHLANFLATKIQLPESKRNHLLSKSKDIAEEMFECLQETLSKIETLDEKHFQIPSNVVLSEDFRYIKDYQENDEEYLQNVVENMKQTFKKNAVMINSLVAENAQYEAISDIIVDELEVAEKVKESFGAINLNKCEEITQQVELAYDKVKTLL